MQYIHARPPHDPDRPLVKLLALAGVAALVGTVALRIVYEEPLPPSLEWGFADATLGTDALGFEVPFLDGGKWTHEEDAEASDGRVLINHVGEGVAGTIALARRSLSPDLRIITRCRTRERDACGVVFRARDAQHHYVARVEPAAQRVVLSLVEGGSERELAAGPFEGTSPWHDLVVDAVGDRLSVTIDGAPVIDHRDATLPAAGQSGMWAPAGGSAVFDVFRVEPLPRRSPRGGKDSS